MHAQMTTKIRGLAWLLIAGAGVLASTPASAALVSATDVNSNPNIFEAYLTAQEQDVNIGGTTIHAWVYKDDPPSPFSSAGAGIPAPEIKVKVGDEIIVHFKNNLPFDSASIHWHGIELDNDSDGTGVTQDAVLPGQSYLYRFKTFRPGLFWYHSHMMPGNATFAGMYGPIVIESPVETSLKGSVLPTNANTHTLVLSDVDFDASGNVGKQFQGATTTINEMVELCHLNAEGEPGGSRSACEIHVGEHVLVNGKQPDAAAQTPKFTVASGQKIRLRLVNASIARHFRMKLLGSGDKKLYRIGGEGGLLDHVVLDGGVKGTWDSLYDLGEVTIGSGDRADVIVMPSGNPGDVIQLVGNSLPGNSQGPYNLSSAFPANYPLAYFVISGTSSDTPIANGDPLLAGTTEDVDNLKNLPTTQHVTSPAPFGGSALETIRLTNQRPDRPMPLPSVDNYSAMLDGNTGNGDFLTIARPPTSRYAHLGDVLEMSVSNETAAVHPFHLHGFSMQPVRYVDNASGTTLYNWNYDEFLDEIDVQGGQTFVFRIRLDDRPKICDGSSQSPGPVLASCSNSSVGGAVGRWLFHCHIFHHAGLGMMGELVVLPDTTPDAFSFPSLTNVARSTLQLSNTVSVNGINLEVPISVIGGEYSANSGPFTSSPSSVINGATLQLRHLSSGAFSTTVTTTLNVGSLSRTFKSTTLAEDLVPDAFAFTPVSGVLRSTQQVSNSITVTGINSASPISVTGGEYSINGGAFASSAATVLNNDTVRVRHVSSPAFFTTVTTTLNIGGVTGGFSSTTLKEDLIPDPFHFDDRVLALPALVYVSNQVTITGINSNSPISLAGGSEARYSINGGAWRKTPTTVQNGDRVRLQNVIPVLQIPGPLLAAHATLTVGGVSDTWTISTLPRL